MPWRSQGRCLCAGGCQFQSQSHLSALKQKGMQMRYRRLWMSEMAASSPWLQRCRFHSRCHLKTGWE